MTQCTLTHSRGAAAAVAADRAAQEQRAVALHKTDTLVPFTDFACEPAEFGAALLLEASVRFRDAVLPAPDDLLSEAVDSLRVAAREVEWLHECRHNPNLGQFVSRIRRAHDAMTAGMKTLEGLR